MIRAEYYSSAYTPVFPFDKRDIAWWNEHPTLGDPVEAHDCDILTRDARAEEIDPARVPLPYDAQVRAGWDRVILAIAPRLATPSLILGPLFVLLGIGGCITTLSGWSIPGLSVLLQNVPLSIALSLTLVRGGLHMIYNGVMASRLENRNRQETQRYYKGLRIKEGIEGLTAEERERGLAEVRRRDNRLAPSMRLVHRLPARGLRGKIINDLPSGRYETYILRKQLWDKILVPAHLDRLVGAAPELRSEGSGTPVLQAQPPPTYTDTWYQFWNKKMGALGTFDMLLGQAMFLVAIGSLFFVACPALSPKILDVITKDPYLSITFAGLLLGHWIHCTRIGWRMRDVHQREWKRASLEDDLQLIDLGLQRQNALHFCEIIDDQLKALGRTDLRRELAQCKEDFLDALPNGPALNTLLSQAETRRQPLPKSLLSRLGKSASHNLGPFSVALGVIIAAFGIACLGMSISQKVPNALSLLAKNTPLSILFSSSLIIAGIDNIHKGAAMGEMRKKRKWKTLSMAYRTDLINALFEAELGEKMRIAPAVRRVTSPKDVPSEWVKGFQTLWKFHGVMGVFLTLSGLAGLFMCMGISANSAFDFIAKDPSFSTTFCISMTAIGFDAILSAWRMYSYKGRKTEDKGDLLILARAHHLLFNTQRLIPKDVFR